MGIVMKASWRFPSISKDFNDFFKVSSIKQSPMRSFDLMQSFNYVTFSLALQLTGTRRLSFRVLQYPWCACHCFVQVRCKTVGCGCDKWGSLGGKLRNKSVHGSLPSCLLLLRGGRQDGATLQ